MKGSPFTLIELLVVVAIIGILASMLLPALVHSKKVANSSVCKHQLRQIATSAMMYSDDWDGVLIHVGGPASSAVFSDLSSTNWYEKIDGYEDVDTARKTLTNCPESVRQFPNRGGSDEAHGYSINHFRGGYLGPTKKAYQDGLRIRLMDEDVFWFADVKLLKKENDLVYTYNELYLDPMGRMTYGTPNKNAPFMWQTQKALAHEPFSHEGHPGDSASFAFADTHVDSLKLNDFADMSMDNLNAMQGGWWF